MDIKQRILASSCATRWFLFGLVLIGILSLISSEWLVPSIASADEQSGRYLSIWARLATTTGLVVFEVAMTTFLLAVAYLLLTPRDDRSGDVSVIEGSDVGRSLHEHLRTTESYWFKGRSARWVRDVVFPILSNRASTDQIRINLFMALPDPSNVKLMKEYADYRESIAYKGSKDTWTQEIVTTHILAAIVSAYHNASKSNFLNVCIGLSDWFPAYRVDITDGSAVMTVEDKNAPAMRYTRTSSFYSTFRADVEHTIEMGTKLPKPVSSFRNRELDATFVNEILAHAGLSGTLNGAVNEESILKKINNSGQLYG
ncbi:hypothetical protein [Parasphingorhabdus sp.]|uniref:hypothetical protein n=1 Tax=Parasphingorhabdus sp. TaxID=2709688 RepID=UPI002F940534